MLKFIWRSEFLTYLIIISGIVAFAPLPVIAQENAVFLREDFSSLDNWKPLEFQSIKRHSVYSIIYEGENSYLKAESDASASGIVFNKEFNVFEYPKIKWRWKISNVYKKGNVELKEGDDYPARIYILFKYDPDNAPFGKILEYKIAKAIYGEYPPDSSLNYIWANRKHMKSSYVSTYADESMMIILESGAELAGMWVEEKANIIEDYRRTFGKDPPPVASLAIMNDSDNTGESSVSYIDYIEIHR